MKSAGIYSSRFNTARRIATQAGRSSLDEATDRMVDLRASSYYPVPNSRHSFPVSAMTEPIPAEDNVETIPLDQFLKLAQVVQSGGEAKMLIQSGVVTVNGAVETRRGRKLRPGDRVEVDGEEFVIDSDAE